MGKLPDSTFLLDGIDTSQGPIFSVSEVAKVFFARSPHWIRWKDPFILDGEDVGGYRVELETGEPGARRYFLSDVEKMTYALAAVGGIDGTQHLNALNVVKAIADLYEMFGPEEVEEPL